MAIIVNIEDSHERGTLHGLNPSLYPVIVQYMGDLGHYSAYKCENDRVKLIGIADGNVSYLDLESDRGKMYRVLKPSEKITLSNSKSSVSYY